MFVYQLNLRVGEMLEWECNCVCKRSVHYRWQYVYIEPVLQIRIPKTLCRSSWSVYVLLFRSRYFLDLSTGTDSMGNEFSTISLLLTQNPSSHIYIKYRQRPLSLSHSAGRNGVAGSIQLGKKGGVPPLPAR
jgi:hypothetical protein